MNIVITGASRGLGKAMAERFAEEGGKMYISSRSDTGLYRALQDLQTRYPQTDFMAKPFDLSQKKDAQALARWVLDFGEPVDILINNAGEFLPGDIHSEDDGILEKMIGTNLYSAYFLTRGLLPHMMERRKGHIFNICSVASLQAYPNGGSYSISKFALAGFSKNLREEMKAYGIKVTAVYPGAVYTDSWAGSGADRHSMMEPRDVADLVYSVAKLSQQANVEDIVLRPLKGDV
jgi:short-subunit dehydrogenase